MIWGGRKRPQLGDRRHRNRYAFWPTRCKGGQWCWLEPIVVTHEWCILEGAGWDPEIPGWVRRWAEPATV